MSYAIKNLTSANLTLEDGQILQVEFTENSNGNEIQFIALPPRGFGVNRSDIDM